MNQRPIAAWLRKRRGHIARTTLWNDGLLAGLLLATVFTTMVWYEAQLYFSGSIRGILVFGLTDVALILALIIILRWLGNWRGWWRGVWPESLAGAVGQQLSAMPTDRLLNALQLERRLENQGVAPALGRGRAGQGTASSGNTDLLERSVELVSQRLGRVNPRQLPADDPGHRRRWLAALALLLGLVWFLWPTELGHGAVRLAHPEREFLPPYPFQLAAVTGDLEILSGDTTEVVFGGDGSLPEAVELVWEDRRGRHSARLAGQSGQYRYSFTDIREDLRYHARYVNPDWFSAWKAVTSDTHTISLQDRPIIEELEFTIAPPAYTGQGSATVGGHVADIAALEGSRVELKGRTNLPLSSGRLHLLGPSSVPADERVNSPSGFPSDGSPADLAQTGETVDERSISVDGQTVRGSFILESSVELFISVVDNRGVGNARPIRYAFTALDDLPPALTMILPAADVQLDETMLIPVQFEASDDFGFSLAQISYRIMHPDYLRQDEQHYSQPIPELAAARKNQQVLHIWELDLLALMPGDAVEFRLEVYDNNSYSEPGQAVSTLFTARVPTLADLFSQAADRSEEVVTRTTDVLANLEEITALLDELDRALKTGDVAPWEQKQEAREALEDIQEVVAAVEQLRAQLEALETGARKNTLFSPELLEKYAQMQNLLEEIMTPELRAAMEKLREALQQADPSLLRAALENLQFHTKDLEAQLNRFLDIFQRALAEMRMEEVVKELQHMAAVEERLLARLQTLESAEQPAAAVQDSLGTSTSERRKDFRDLAARHKEQERSFRGLRYNMTKAAEAMEPLSSEAARRLSDLENSSLADETQLTLRRGSQAMASQSEGEQFGSAADGPQSGGRGAGQTAGQWLEESQQQLEALREGAEDIREAFQDATVNEMTARFQRVLSGVLALSKFQETLHEQTVGLGRQSPRTRDRATQQHQLRIGLGKLLEQLIALSQVSFHITPQIGRTIAKANEAMVNSVQRLEENDPAGAAGWQRTGMTALNETALALQQAMQAMEQSGSASGFNQFLARMQGLSQGQQALNEQSLSLQLGGIAAAGQLALMRRLQAQQRQLERALDQVLEEFPTQSRGREGGLGQARREMEAVIEDFQRRRITRRTLDRQRRILSRLLDSQKSLAVQDLKEERKGQAAAERYAYTGPSGLPSRLGQRNDMILQAMDKALRAGYLRDYQAVIRTYFQRLSHPPSGSSDHLPSTPRRAEGRE